MNKIKIDKDTWGDLLFEMGQEFLYKSAFNYGRFVVKETYSKLIYHYTSIDTFKKIVESQCIHATNISYLNDSTELDYAKKLFINNIKKILKKKKNNIEQKVLTNLISLFENTEKSTRFVSCFSINGDLLHQWKKYADKGKGVSIGFHQVNLQQTLDPITNHYYIIYNKKEQVKLIDNCLNKTLDFFMERYNRYDWNGHDSFSLVAQAIYKYCENYLCQFKDRKYHDEKEFRYEIQTDFIKNYKITVLEGKENKKPYIANKTDFQRRLEKKKSMAEFEYQYDVNFHYQIYKLPIEEIILLDNQEFEEKKFELTSFLNNHQYFEVDFRKSKYNSINNEKG